ncbi:MAG: hypothetical protein J6T14_07125 [Clostridia bacterium]|nr:hypothetical protein [Clostridia bacterium]
MKPASRLMAFLRFMALLCGTAMTAAVTRAGDLGPVGSDMGSRMWPRNDYVVNGTVRVYKKDPVLNVGPLMVWTNAHVEVPRPFMVVTGIVHSCRVQYWSTTSQSGRVAAHKLGGPYMRFFHGWIGTYRGASDGHGGLVWDKLPDDYVDPYVVATNEWAIAEASSSTSAVTWDELLSVTETITLYNAYDPVPAYWYSSAPAFLGVQDGTVHSLPCTFSNLGWLPSTNYTFKLSTGFDGYVHMTYHSESNTVTFTRLYGEVLPYDETH